VTIYGGGGDADRQLASSPPRRIPISLRAAIGAENRFRSDHDLPLLPKLSLDQLAEPLLDPWNRSG
jgi:hypothetical protein